MWFIIVYTLLTTASASPNIISELASSGAESVKFASNPADLARKAKGTADFYRNFQDKSQLPQKNFTLEEVARCDGEDGRDFLIIIKDVVYDVKEFAQYHPAGYEPLKRHAGQDATTAVKLSGMPPESYEPFLKYFKVGSIVKAERDKTSALHSFGESVKSVIV